MTKEGISMLEEKIIVLTKKITTLNESLKNDRLMRLMMIKKQCEDVSMPLGCMGLENGSPKEKVECVLEEEHMEVSFTSLEPKFVCVENEHEEVVSNEPEIVVRVEEVDSLKGSSLDEPRQEGNAAGVLMCTCECCVEFEDHKDDELLGLEEGLVVTMSGVEVHKGLTTKEQGGGLYTVLLTATQNLIFCCDSHPSVKTVIYRGKICNFLTPHFHFHMLVQLMVGLVDMDVAMNLFEWRNDECCLSLHELPKMNIFCEILDENCLELTCLSIIMSREGSWCQGLAFMLFLTQESVRETKMEQHKCFCFHTPISESKTEFIGHEVCLVGCHLNEVLGKCVQGYVVKLFEGNNLRKLLNLQLGRNCNQRGAYHSNLLICFYLGECDLVFEVLIPWDVACEENEFIRNFFELFRVEYMGIRQWVRMLIKYALTWLEWLVVKGARKGDSFNLLWTVENDDTQCVDGGLDCRVLIMPWGSLESDSSWGREINNMLMQMSIRNCHVSVLKVSKVNGPSLKGTEHGLAYMSNLDEITCDSESCQIQSGAAESIAKCYVIANLESKQMMMMLFDAREAEQVTMLKWTLKGLSTSEFKAAWVKNISAETGVMRAACDNIIKSMIEWMIAW